MRRAIASHGAFAILYGRHSKHYIKKPEVCQSTIPFPPTPGWLYDHFVDLSIKSCLSLILLLKKKKEVIFE
jgi:hypothetical protein